MHGQRWAPQRDLPQGDGPLWLASNGSGKLGAHGEFLIVSKVLNCLISASDLQMLQKVFQVSIRRDESENESWP